MRCGLVEVLGRHVGLIWGLEAATPLPNHTPQGLHDDSVALHVIAVALSKHGMY